MLAALTDWCKAHFRRMHLDADVWKQVVFDDACMQREFTLMAYSLYDAILFWMGPGGDPAFLDLFLFAESRLPPLLVHCEGTLSPHNGKAWREKIGGILRGHHRLFRGMLPSLDLPPWGAKRCDRETRSLLHELRKRSMDGLWHAVELRRAAIRLFWSPKSISGTLYFRVLAAPGRFFLRDLMAEQATPWPRRTTVPSSFLRPPRLVRRPA